MRRIIAIAIGTVIGTSSAFATYPDAFPLIFPDLGGPENLDAQLVFLTVWIAIFVILCVASISLLKNTIVVFFNLAKRRAK